MITFQASEEVSKILTQIKTVLTGADNHDVQTDQVAQLSQEVYNSDLLPMLVQNVSKIDFEVKMWQVPSSSKEAVWRSGSTFVF